jgi:hypothetical protein
MFVMPFPKANLKEMQDRLLWHGRSGTARADRGLLDAHLGKPNRLATGDSVTMGWIFATPHGIAEIRDYWWNSPGEWSLTGESHDAVEDLSAALVLLGFTVDGWECVFQ